MRKIKIITACIFSLLIFACCFLYAAEEQTEKLLERYNYDRNLPLNAEENLKFEQGPFKAYLVYYDSVNGERVPALLTIPNKGTPPFPCVIVQHGYGGDKTFALILAGSLTNKGYATIAIDAEYHGEREVKGKDIFSVDIESDAAALLQTVIDLRRTVDYLQTRKDIDPNRIGYIGVSMGGFLGSVFCGVEQRAKTCILVVAGGNWKLVVRNSQIEPAIAMRKYAKEHNLSVDEMAGKMDFVDPVNFIGLISPRPVLFLNGKEDTIVPPVSTEALYAAAKEPKKIIWYNRVPPDTSGHLVPPLEALNESIKWFKKYL